MALTMATAAASTVFSTPQAKRRRSRKNRRSYCDHHCDEGGGGENRHLSSVNHDGSYLTLSSQEMVIDLSNQQRSANLIDHDLITLNWHIAEDVNPLDWIGLYLVGEKIFRPCHYMIRSKIFLKKLFQFKNLDQFKIYKNLIFEGEKNPFRYLDYRSHGLRCQTSGQLQWKLNPELFGRSKI